MGALPQSFYSNRAKAESFINEVQEYLRLNADVAGYNSPMKKVVLTLMLMKGLEIAGWRRNMGLWIDRLDPLRDNIPNLWTQFLQEFQNQFQDTLGPDKACQELQSLTMKGTAIDDYITKFEEVCRCARYT